MGVVLEICVEDAAGVAAAVSGGADRLELCTGLELGGLTPSAAFVSHAVQAGPPVHVLVRPRSGSFVLEADEAALMVDDIEAALARGAAGVVVGDRLAVIAGGGVRPDNVAAVVAATGVREVHSSARSRAGETDDRLRRFGFASGAGLRTDAAVVAALRGCLDGEETDHG